nr:hypothetical protein [Tanacetum cinerariifolium]
YTYYFKMKVNAATHKLTTAGDGYCCWCIKMKVNAATHKLTTAGDGYCCWESDGFEQIVDFLNANPIKYALIVSLTITLHLLNNFGLPKVKTVNDDVWIQALVDGKKVVVNEASIRHDLRLDDAERTACLPNAAIFEELARMGFIQVFVNHQLGDMSHHKGIFVNLSLTKKIFANMKRVGTCFFRAITPLFVTMMVQAPEEVEEIPTDAQDTPILTQPSSSQPQRKHKIRRKQRKETEVPQEEPPTEEHIHATSYDLLPSGEDRLQLKELMKICTKLSDNVLYMEQTKTSQAAEIEKLKKRAKKLEDKKMKRTHRLKRLYKGRMNEEDLFGVHDLSGDEVFVDVTTGENIEQDATAAEKEVSTADPVTTAGELVTIAENVKVVAAVTTLQISKDELTLARTLMEIKTAKPKAKGVTIQEPFDTPSPKPIVSFQKPSKPKDKGKAKMVEPERPLKRKDQIMMDEQIARDLEAQMQDNLEEEQRIIKQKEKEANTAMIAEWDNTQAMIDADCKLATKLQVEERGELSIKEKSKLFVELMNKRKNHFKKLRAEEKKRKPPTKAQKRKQMCTYLNNMAGFTHNQLKRKSFEEV